MLCRVCRVVETREGEDVCGASCEALLDEELPEPGVLVDADDSEPAPVRTQPWLSGGVMIVPAPGDRCGGSRKLADGARCPGCRACS